LTEPWTPADHSTGQQGLRRQVARGLTWTFVHTWGGQLLSLVVFLVLARLLTPGEFGLVAYAALFVGLAQIVIDQGFGDALIQRPSVTRSQIDTAFWVAVATGAVLTVIGIVFAGPLAALLTVKEPASAPRLTPIIQALSLLFIISSFSSTQQALLRRELAFRSLATRGLLSLAGGGAVGIVLAFLNFGPWALVAQQLAAAAISVVALWTISPWRPGLQLSRRDFGELFNFGIKIVGTDFLGFLSRNSDNFLVGIFLGEVALGLYAVAYRILDTTEKVLVSVSRRLAFPALAKLQREPERMAKAYLTLTRIGGSAILPGYVGLALVAPELTVVMFGPQWAKAGLVSSVLFLIGPVVAMQAFSGSLFTAAGHPSVVFRFRFLVTVTNIIGFILAVQVGKDILWVAFAFALRGYLLLPLNLSWQRKYGGVATSEYLAQFRGSGIGTLLMIAMVLLVKFGVGPHVGTTLLLLLEVVAGAATFVVALWIFDRRLLLEMWRITRQSIPGLGRLSRSVSGRMNRSADADLADATSETKAEPLSPSVRGEK